MAMAFPSKATLTDSGSEGMTLRDYLIAHAPPIPQFILDARVKAIQMDDPELASLPWNIVMLEKMAVLHRRWACAYADEVLSKRDKKE